MTVTELAVYHAKTGTVTDILKKTLIEVGKAVARNQPGSSPPSERGEAMFEQVEDPAKFLLTCAWESRDAHLAWLRNEEGKTAIDLIGAEADTDLSSPNRPVLRHVEGALFAGPPPPGIKHTLDAPIVSVGRTYIPAANRPAASRKMDEIADALREFAAPYESRWGWVADPADAATQEFVIVAGWESVEAHLAFKRHPTFAKWQEFTTYADSTGFVHYKRFH